MSQQQMGPQPSAPQQVSLPILVSEGAAMKKLGSFFYLDKRKRPTWLFILCLVFAILISTNFLCTLPNAILAMLYWPRDASITLFMTFISLGLGLSLFAYIIYNHVKPLAYAYVFENGVILQETQKNKIEIIPWQNIATYKYKESKQLVSVPWVGTPWYQQLIEVRTTFRVQRFNKPNLTFHVRDYQPIDAHGYPNAPSINQFAARILHGFAKSGASHVPGTF